MTPSTPTDVPNSISSAPHAGHEPMPQPFNAMTPTELTSIAPRETALSAENSLDSLHTARAALEQAQQEIEARLQQVQNALEHAQQQEQSEQSALTQAIAAAEQARAQADAAQVALSHAQASITRAQQDASQAQAEVIKLQAETAQARADQEAEDARLQREIEGERAASEQLRQEAASHAENAREHEAKADNLEDVLSDQKQRNHDLRHQLLDLHHDLMASDVPTLILRIGMGLTGSEQGLFVGEDGHTTLASIGLDEIPPEIADALYKFTDEAMERDEPIVRNDSKALPDGSNLVNLAALPVALHGVQSGAMVVANKRSGDFDDEDTELLLSVGRHAGIALENRRLHQALADSYVSTIAVLADAIEAKDPYTRGHCESVSRIAVEVAQRMGCEPEELERVRYAALLHDVGKIGVSDGVLLKPGKLLPEEFMLIQKHSAIGSDLVKRVPGLIPIAPLILHHHERMDGSGYPDGLTDSTIPLGARIIGVVDALDAMTTPRPYRNPVGIPEALNELKHCAGTQFDARIVAVIEEVLCERGDVPSPEAIEAALNGD